MKSFFKKNTYFIKNKLGFTLIELVVSVSITSILFIFLFAFVIDSLTEIENSKRKTDFFSDFGSFNIKMKNISETFPKYSFIQNFTSGSGLDILLMKNSKNTFGVALGVVDVDSMKFTTNYEYYGEKNLGYVELKEADLIAINSNSGKIYDYKIFQDKLFSNIFVKDFQVELYNTSKLLDINIDLIPYYLPGFDGVVWKDIDQKNFFKLVLNY